MFNLNNSVCGIRCPVITSLTFYVWILDKLFYTFCVIDVCCFKLYHTLVKVIGTFGSKILSEWCMSNIAFQIYGEFSVNIKDYSYLFVFKFLLPGNLFFTRRSSHLQLNARPDQKVLCTVIYNIWSGYLECHLFNFPCQKLITLYDWVRIFLHKQLIKDPIKLLLYLALNKDFL